MSGSWVAGTVRCRALISRRLGRAGTRSLARSASLDQALGALAAGPYGHDVRPGSSLAAAQQAVAAALLWNLRVLAGWLPRDGVATVRALAGWFELAGIDEVVRALSGLDAGPAYTVGTLGIARSEPRHAASLPDLRARLARTPWGDPGGDSAWEIQLGVRLAWAERIAHDVPAAAAWAAAGTALLIAREVVLTGRRLPAGSRVRADRLLAPASAQARDLRAFTAGLPLSARWAVEGLEEPGDLWRAEPRFWTHVEDEAFALARSPAFGPAAVVGAIALLAVDAWRTRVALALAGSLPASGMLDALL
ncbi:MAG: hypothetical protein ACXV3S_00030 [Kineosporiaceae bacterium]